MKIKRFTLKNVRSFLDEETLELDSNISIIIGPNGGGKTNLLDAIKATLKRHILHPWLVDRESSTKRIKFFRHQASQTLNLERYIGNTQNEQYIEIEIEATAIDIENINIILENYPSLEADIRSRYEDLPVIKTIEQEIRNIKIGDQFKYTIHNGSLAAPPPKSRAFLTYLNCFEIYSTIMSDFGIRELNPPVLYLPANRALGGIGTSITLAQFKETELREGLELISSRSTGSLPTFAIAKLAAKYRQLLEKDNISAREAFNQDQSVKEISAGLEALGYEWALESGNIYQNEYTVTLKKQGTAFSISTASSGEKELLTYIFAISGLRIQHATILIDEPELHLHPQWQTKLFNLFKNLAQKTGNQLILATHSPSFITPDSIEYVSRVYSEDQISHITRLNHAQLPDRKHLFNIVNTQNNERLFFADKVILVEGASDRIFFSAVLKKQTSLDTTQSIEILDVGGKSFFPRYSQLLEACKVKYCIIADQDYAKDLGAENIKSLFTLNTKGIKQDVIDNVKSTDGQSLVKAIDSAMETKNWDHAQELWTYIKSRRIKLKEHLSKEDEAILFDFINQKQEERIFILKRGELEDYIPSEYHTKDLDKLIRFVSTDTFFEELEEPCKKEILDILNKCLNKPNGLLQLKQEPKSGNTA